MTFRPMMANAAWCAASVPSYVMFRSALGDPRRIQLQLLRRYLRHHATTAFGKAHGFSTINDVAGFRQRVPVRDYDGLAPWIDRVAAGEHRVLSEHPVTRLMPSSGSTRAAKLIPYTAELQQEFNRAIGPWVVELYRQTPDLMRGSAYWSITPVAQAPTHKRNFAVPVGFDEDSAYLGGLRKRLVDAVMAVPGDVRHIQEVRAFRFATLRHLLARRDLRLVSVWHPSFLELLLDEARVRWGDLLEAIVPSDPARAAELRELGAEEWSAIWPRLRLVSCWADANASGPAESLRRRLPHVALQPKGLLATEAFISIPFAGKWPLAVCSHFLEFEDDDGRMLLADELRCGDEYGMIVTTAGGLWRYRLGDRVHCDGGLGRTPSVRFIGRNDLVVDRFGEKLSEGFVGQTIRNVLAGAQVQADFAMLAPDEGVERTCYTLFLSTTSPIPAALSTTLDQALRANPHYAYCRDLGQLGHPRLFCISFDAYATYVIAAGEFGKRLGDIKPVALHARSDWSRRFSGGYAGEARRYGHQP